MIVSGEIPSTKIYEDEDILAFLDIMPVNYGHTLVIPKIHYKSIEDLPDEILSKLILAVKKIIPAVKDTSKTSSINLNVNNGEEAGQIVPHVHFHIIPRKSGDGLELWKGGKYEEGQPEKLAEKIRKSLQS